SGTTRVPPRPESGEKLNDPNATRPLPGSPTGSSTSARELTRSHQSSASRNREVPSVRQEAARPHPTRPSPSRTHASRSAGGTSAGRWETSGAVRSTSTVRARSRGGARTVTAVTVCRGVTMAPMSRASLDKQPHEVAGMCDEVAGRYDLTNDVLSLGMGRRWRKAVVAAVEVRPGEVGLDIAAGTGTSSMPFHERGAYVVPADFSLGMLREGR